MVLDEGGVLGVMGEGGWCWRKSQARVLLVSFGEGEVRCVS